MGIPPRLSDPRRRVLESVETGSEMVVAAQNEWYSLIVVCKLEALECLNTIGEAILSSSRYAQTLRTL